MKHSIIRRLALLLALAVLLSMVGLAEELSLNALELPEIDMEGMSLEDVLIGEGDELELVDLEDEIELPGTADGTGVATDAALPDGTAFLEDLDGAVDEAAASIASDSVQNGLVLIDEEIEQTGGAGDGYWEDHYIVPGAQADNDALADAYLRCVLPGFGKGGRTLASPGTGRKALVKKGLTGTVALYDAMKPMIVEVAEGKRTSTEFKFDSNALGTADHWWTPEDLGIANFDDDGVTGNALLAKETIVTSALMDALLQDCPYHLYWYEKKTQGMHTLYGWSSTGSSVQLTSLTIQMTVAGDYAAGTYAVNALPGYVNDAVSNINKAISNNAGKGDYDKLTAYANLVCGYVEYNHPAADNDNTPYGNPWQLVWIFDGDPDTKVVCEGYAKGFKYLCDLSDFQGDVGCALVTGTLSGGTGSGGHMWNSLKMPDGKCYLVDLTNCDTGFSLFLKGCTGNAGGPYTCDGLSFKFDSDLADRFGGDTSWLTYSNTDYDPSAPVPDPTVAPTAKPTVAPTAAPTVKPTAAPTAQPTAAPTVKPTAAPTVKPTAAPTAKPTVVPTAKTTAAPTAKPTAAPTAKPTVKPTVAPTAKPTVAPTAKPTAAPTAKPTAKPTAAPTVKPTATPKVDISKCKVTVKDQTYTGKALKPAVTVKYGSATLKQDTDYTVTYKNNVKPGKATVTVTGKGSYTGSAKVTFRILVPLSKCRFTVKSQTYTGKALQPAVTVKYGSKVLKKGTDYTVSYKNNKAVGVATVTVKGKGGYTGTKKLTFKILPRAVAISKLTAGKQRLTVKWARRAEATGYELQYALKRSFAGARTVKIKKNATVSATIKKLKKGKTYYVRLRSYKTVGKKTYYSAWSKGKGMKVK